MARISNGDKSDSMNSNSDVYWGSLDNHANQINPNHGKYQKYYENELKN